MSITAEKKQKVIKDHGRGEGDTGSPEVQVAILTSRIQTLTDQTWITSSWAFGGYGGGVASEWKRHTGAGW